MAVVELEDGDVPGALLLIPIYVDTYLYFSKNRNSVKGRLWEHGSSTDRFAKSGYTSIFSNIVKTYR